MLLKGSKLSSAVEFEVVLCKYVLCGGVTLKGGKFHREIRPWDSYRAYDVFYAVFYV